MPRAVLRGACLQYTMAPRSGPDKTAFTAVLHGSMFSSPVRESASAHEERAAAQAAGLRLLYHDAAKRPRQNRMCCGFAWFNVLKPCARKRISARRARGRASGGLEVIIPWRREAASTKPHSLRFCMVQCSQVHARKRISARRARGRASGGLEVIIPYFRLYVMLSVHICQKTAALCRCGRGCGGEGKMTVRGGEAMAAKRTAAQGVRSEMRPNGSKGRSGNGSRVWEKRKAPAFAGPITSLRRPTFLALRK